MYMMCTAVPTRRQHIFRLFSGWAREQRIAPPAGFQLCHRRSRITRLAVTMPRTSFMLSLALFLVATATGAEERWQVPGQEQLPDIDDVLADFKVSTDDDLILCLATMRSKSRVLTLAPLHNTTGCRRRLTCGQGTGRDRGYLQGTQSRKDW